MDSLASIPQSSRGLDTSIARVSTARGKIWRANGKVRFLSQSGQMGYEPLMCRTSNSTWQWTGVVSVIVPCYHRFEIPVYLVNSCRGFRGACGESYLSIWVLCTLSQNWSEDIIFRIEFIPCWEMKCACAMTIGPSKSKSRWYWQGWLGNGRN